MCRHMPLLILLVYFQSISYSFQLLSKPKHYPKCKRKTKHGCQAGKWQLSVTNQNQNSLPLSLDHSVLTWGHSFIKLRSAILAKFVTGITCFPLLFHGPPMLVDKTNLDSVIYNHANFFPFEETSNYWLVERIPVFLCFSLINQWHTFGITVYNRTVTSIENTEQAVHSCNSWFLIVN